MFKFKHNLIKSGILKGKTDIHCHVLPGVDDGSPDIDSSLELLDFMEDIGLVTVWLTPHVMADMGNTPTKLKEVYEEFLPHYEGGLNLNLASEYMMDADFEDHITTDFLKLGSDHLLVETSYIENPAEKLDLLLKVWKMNLQPLIAHPERYRYMTENDYHVLKEHGYEFQLNLMSLSGYYGGQAKFVSEQLLERRMYDYVGSDLHHLHHYEPMLQGLKLTRKQLDALERLFDNNSQV